jgi:hypothetical protein
MALKIYIDETVTDNRQIIFEHTTSNNDTGTVLKVQAKLEPRYNNSAGTVAFLHDHDSYLRFEEAAAPGVLKEYFLASEIQDSTGTPVGDLDAVKKYLSDKMGFKTGGGTPLTTSVDRFDAFVGTGDEEFAQANLAVSSGRVRILTKTNTTEASDLVVTSKTVLSHIVPDTNSDYGSNNITLDGSSPIFIKEGGGTITYSSAITQRVFFQTGESGGEVVIWDGGTFVNNSTINATFFASDNIIQKISNTTFVLPNFSDCGVIFDGIDSNRSFIKDTTFIGGGSDCHDIIEIENGTVSGIVLEGTFSNTPGDEVIIAYGIEALISDVQLISSNQNIEFLAAGGIWKNIRHRDGSNSSIKIVVDQNQVKVSDSTLVGGLVVQSDNCSIKGLDTTPIEITSSGGGNSIVSCMGINGLLIDGNNNSLVSNRSASITDDLINGNDNIISDYIHNTGTFKVFGERNSISNLRALNSSPQIIGNSNRVVNYLGGSGTLYIGGITADPTVAPPSVGVNDVFWLDDDPAIIGVVHPGWGSPLPVRGDTVRGNGVDTDVIPAPTGVSVTLAPAPYRKVTLLTRSGTTATATSPAHGFSNGAVVSIFNADSIGFNLVDVVISGVTLNTFNYTVSGTETTPDIGTNILVRRTSLVVDNGIDTIISMVSI